MDDEYIQTAKPAYNLWEQRGRPLGSPNDDWFRAEREVKLPEMTTIALEPAGA